MWASEVRIEIRPHQFTYPAMSWFGQWQCLCASYINNFTVNFLSAVGHLYHLVFTVALRLRKENCCVALE